LNKPSCLSHNDRSLTVLTIILLTTLLASCEGTDLGNNLSNTPPAPEWWETVTPDFSEKWYEEDSFIVLAPQMADLQQYDPILLISNVLSPEECRRLTDSVELGGPFYRAPTTSGRI
jgi:hypothetical protein